MAQSTIERFTQAGGDRALLAAAIYTARRDVAGRGLPPEGPDDRLLSKPLVARRFLQTTGRRWLATYFDADDARLERLG